MARLKYAAYSLLALPLLFFFGSLPGCGKKGDTKAKEDDPETRLVKEVASQFVTVLGNANPAEARNLMSEDYLRAKKETYGLPFPVNDVTINTVEIFKDQNQASVKGTIGTRYGERASFTMLLVKEDSRWKISSFSNLGVRNGGRTTSMPVTPWPRPTGGPSPTWAPTPFPDPSRFVTPTSVSFPSPTKFGEKDKF